LATTKTHTHVPAQERVQAYVNGRPHIQTHSGINNSTSTSRDMTRVGSAGDCSRMAPLRTQRSQTNDCRRRRLVIIVMRTSSPGSHVFTGHYKKITTMLVLHTHRDTIIHISTKTSETLVNSPISIFAHDARANDTMAGGHAIAWNGVVLNISESQFE
jgi:hypothetical protein